MTLDNNATPNQSLQPCINQLIKNVAFCLLQNRSPVKLWSGENLLKAIAWAFNNAQNSVDRNGVWAVTFIIHPIWWATQAEADMNPRDITHITALPSEKWEESNTTPRSSFDVGADVDMSRTERLIMDISNKFLKTVENGVTDTVWAIKAKNTRNNIDYDATLWNAITPVPAGVEECQVMHNDPYSVFNKQQLISMTLEETIHPCEEDDSSFLILTLQTSNVATTVTKTGRLDRHV